MACSVQYIWHATPFSYNGTTTQTAPIANNTSVSDSDIELLNCRDNIFEATSNVSIVWNTATRKYFGGKLEVANLLTSGCESGLTWDVLARVIISWKPQFKTKNGLTISNQTFNAEWNTSYRNDMPVNRISDTYDTTYNNILYNILFEVPTDSDISPAIQREVDAYCASINDEFDRYISTPYFYVSKFCIVKNWGGTGCVGNYSYNCACDGGDCLDSRTTTNPQTLRLTFSDGVSSVTKDINFNVSSSASTHSLIDYLTSNEYLTLIEMFNQHYNDCRFACRFVGGGIRDDIQIKITARVGGSYFGLNQTAPIPIWEYDILTDSVRDVFVANFVPCSDKPSSFNNGNISSYIDGLNQGREQYWLHIDDFKIVFGASNSLSNYCCDEITPSDDDEDDIIPINIPLIYGLGGDGGGGDVDITCICNALSNINDTLSAFKTANETALGGINDTLSAMNIQVDNQCVCDNLEDVVDGLGAIKDSIDDKVLSVTNNNTVNPPVNNVAVNPPVNNVSVTVPTTELADISSKLNQLQYISGHLNNSVVELGNIESDLKCNNSSIACIINSKNPSTTVNFDTSSIVSGLSSIEGAIDDNTSELSDISGFCSASADSLSCDDEGLACIIKEALNTSGVVSDSITDVLNNALNTSDDESEGLTDVIKNKEMGTNIDVEVSPADDVNINRVYYTNQRNGETNI